MLAKVRAIITNDARRLLRDQFLLGTSVYIVVVALALRWLVPWMQAALLESNGVDIGPYVPMGVSYFVLVNSSILTGMVGGFLLLENREERTLSAMMVTPTPLAVPLATLGGMIVLVGSVIPVALSAAIGVGVPPLGVVLLSALVASPMGVAIALLLATVASNKVEAFAAMKFTSILGLVPVGAFFLPEPWQYLAGLVPIYWPCKMWWLAAAGEGGWAWMMAPALLVEGVWVWALVRRFTATAA